MRRRKKEPLLDCLDNNNNKMFDEKLFFIKKSQKNIFALEEFAENSYDVLILFKIFFLEKQGSQQKNDAFNLNSSNNIVFHHHSLSTGCFFIRQ